HVTNVVVVDVDGWIRDRQSIGEDVFWAIRGGGGNTFDIVAAWKVRWQQIADTLPGELFIRVVIFKEKNSAPTNLVVRYFKGKSDYVTRAIPQSGLEGIWETMLREDIEEKYLILAPYGGTMSRIPETAIPFPHRKRTMFKIQYLVYWTQDGEEVSDRHTSWMTDLYRYMTPYVSSNPRAAYVNYRDADIGANNFGGGTTYERTQIWGAKYFKGNFDCLVAVKTAFDPTNFFCNEQSVPPLAGANGNGRGSRHRKKNGARSGGHCWFCNIFFICIVVLWI
ncbi:Berberine bridge enzyme-like 27, partial [Linum grandiflorum]